MKKRNTFAILLASTIMLALVGCEGATNATEGSSELEMTEETKRELAKAEMVASEDASAVASSEASTATEAASAASSEASSAAASSEASAAADSSKVSAATAASTTSTNNKDAATTASSAEKASTLAATESNKSTASSNTANKSDNKDYQFTYNGTVISILDSFNSINNALGGYYPNTSNIQNLQSYYSYGKNDAVGMISRNDFGTETPITISTREPVITTSRGIKVGSSKDELIAAYGTPNGKHSQVFDGATGKELTEEEYVANFGESFVYDLGDIQISFSVSNGKVASIEYKNNVNYKKFQWS